MLFGSLRAETDGRRGFAQEAGQDDSTARDLGAPTRFAQKSAGPSTITRHDGGDAGPAGLDYLFGGPDARTIGSLLTFDITDLQTFPVLASPRFATNLSAGCRAQPSNHSARCRRDSDQEIRDRQRGNAERQKQSTAPVELQSRIERSTRAAARIGQLVQVARAGAAHVRSPQSRHYRI
jgi:hypothetical protein